MFLLFPRRAYFHRERNFIYIPICFYYFGTITGTFADVVNIYIPICFYYFESVRKIQRHSFIIYIPICFYYFTETYTLANFAKYLHSNMFLLFLVHRYIVQLATVIYIPICFYYFVEHIDDTADVRSFTFQYVSIISK